MMSGPGRGKESGSIALQKVGPPSLPPRIPSDIPGPIAGALSSHATQEEQEYDVNEMRMSLLPAKNAKMEEDATHMLEQITEFIKSAVAREGQPLHFDASNPLDQILKGFTDNGGGSSDMTGFVSNLGNGEWGEGGGIGRGGLDNGLSHYDGIGLKPSWDYTLIESNDSALLPIQHAILDGKSNANWYFSTNQNESVSSLLDWIQTTEHHLGELGLRKFLHCGKRGALFTNANYHLRQDLQQPVFDWITFDDIQRTGDDINQESIISYDPAIQVVIFILIPSDMGNSVAMWVRKIDVPNSVQSLLQSEIQLAMHRLVNQQAPLRDFAGAELTKNMMEVPLGTPLEKSSEVSPDTILPYRSGLYHNLCSLIRQQIAGYPDHEGVIQIQETLQQVSDSLASLNDLMALSRSNQFRAQLMELCTTLGILDSSSVRQALQSDEEHIFLLLQKIVSTKDSSRKAILSLKETDAENFMDLLQATRQIFR